MTNDEFYHAVEAAREQYLQEQAAQQAAAAPPPPADESSAVGAAAEGIGAGVLGAIGAIPSLGAAGVEALAPAGSGLESGARSVREALSGRALLGSAVGAARQIGGQLVGEEGAVASGEAARAEYDAGARARAEQHPWAAGLGELTGTVAGTIATGGLGGLAAAGRAGAARALGTGTLARFGARAAEGAIEGAAFGAAAENSEAYLQQRRLTGEQFLAGAGLSALMGGGLSIAAEGAHLALSAGRRAVSGRLTGRVAAPTAERVAVDDAAMRATVETEIEHKAEREIRLRSDQDVAAAYRATSGEDAVPEMPRMFRDLVGGKNVKAATLSRATEELAPVMTEAHSVARSLTDAIDDRFHWKRNRVASNLEEKGFAAEAPVVTRQLVAQQRAELADAVGQLKAIGNAPKTVLALGHEMDRTLAKMATADAADVYILQDALRAKQLKVANYLNTMSRATDADSAAIGGELQKIVGSHYDQSWSSLMRDDLWGAQGAAQSAVNKARVQLISTEKQALPAFFQKSGTQYEGRGIARDTFEAHEGQLQSGLDAMTNAVRGKPIRRNMERWMDAVAEFGSAMKQYGVAEAEAAKLSASAEKLREVFNRVGSETRAIEQAERMAATHSTLGGIFGHGVVGTAIGSATNPALRVKQLIRIEHVANRSRVEIGRALDTFVNGFSRVTGPVAAAARRATRAAGQLPASGAIAYLQGSHSTPEAGYRAKAQEVIDANRGGGEQIRVAVANALGPLATRDVAMGMAVVGAATRGYQFLADKLPAPLYSVQSFTPVSSRPTPSRLEMTQFARYVQAVESPMSVLSDVKNGTVTHEQISALKAVYPELYGHIREETLARLRSLDEQGESVPIRQRLVLDTLLDLGGAGDPVLSPQFGAKWGPKMGDSAAQAKENAARPAGGGKQIRLGDRLATGTNSMIGGDGT